MTESKIMTHKIRVRYTEYERGWGSRPDGFKDFDTLQEAIHHMDEFNAKNTAESVPDWYMVAEYPVVVNTVLK